MPELVTTLGAILLASELGGWVAHRLRTPRVVGQIVAGIILGPSVFGIIRPDVTVAGLAELGAIAILGLAGLETNRQAMRSVGSAALLTAAGGVILPFIAGLTLALWFGLSPAAAAFTGAILTATSVGITARTLVELGIAEGRAAATILAAAVIDDVLGLVVLAMVAGWAVPTSSPVALLLPMLATLAAVAVGLKFLPIHLDRVIDALHFRGGGPAGAFGLVLGAAWFVQTVGGLAGITGAYVAGVALADVRLGPHVREHVERTVQLILAPAFFVSIGVTADLRAGAAAAPFLLALIVVAVLTKVVGASLGARVGGLNGAEAGLVGVGMTARGEVALVAATLGQQAGIVDASLYSAVVVMSLVTTIVAPIGMAAWCRLMAHREATGHAGLPAGALAADKLAADRSAGLPVMSQVGSMHQSLIAGAAFSNAIRVEAE